MEEGRKCPPHVAIIMDGNRRWARLHDPSARAIIGHKAGYESLKGFIKNVLNFPGLQVLTVYAFSTENWKRSLQEVESIMQLALFAFLSDFLTFSHNIRLRIIGDRTALNSELQAAISNAEQNTSNNQGLLLVVAFNYGGHWDISEGFRSFSNSLLLTLSRELKNPTDAGKLVDDKVVQSFLPTSFLPPVDLLIRTGGEKRISNFLPWQLAYAEIYFTDILWPEFSIDVFCDALDWFAGRKRRFGEGQ